MKRPSSGLRALYLFAFLSNARTTWAQDDRVGCLGAYCPNLSSGAAIGIIVALSIVCVILFAIIVFALLRCRRTRQSQKQLMIEQEERAERMRQHRTTYSSFPSVPIVTLSPIHAHHHNYVHVP